MTGEPYFGAGEQKRTESEAAFASLRFTYEFQNFYHPLVDRLIEELNDRPLSDVLSARFQGDEGSLPKAAARRNQKISVSVDFQKQHFETAPGSPYGVYNWELFFHVPFTIAVHLSRNQRFAEAQRWFHLIFDPLSNDETDEEPDRYWRFAGFRDERAVSIDAMMRLLSTPEAKLDADDRRLRTLMLESQRAAIREPFQPHAVARVRPVAYMYAVVMRYLDNLIAWGDHLFRQDSMDSINRATQIYVLASNILGNRPERVPNRGEVRPLTYSEIRRAGGRTGNPVADLEGQFPYFVGLPGGGRPPDRAAPLFGIGRTLYFCIPANPKMLGYWDKVADRLSKIRQCMNIEGVRRQLPLYESRIDPGLLVKARAAGIDIGAVVAGVSQPVSHVRAEVLLRKALELSDEVRSLGSALLQAIEKKDAEQLSLLRQGHEVRIQRMQQDIRFLSWKQAEEATEALLKGRAAALERYRNALRLLGLKDDPSVVPETPTLDRREISEESFSEDYAEFVGQYEREVAVPDHPDLGIEASPSADAGATGRGTLALISEESEELENLKIARDLGLAASITEAAAPALAVVPDMHLDLHYWGIGSTLDLKTGEALVKIAELTARGMNMASAWHRDEAGLAARTAGHRRRVDEVTHLANLAARELQQIGRQIIASLIAEQTARRDYEAVKQRIEDAAEIDRFLQDKFSSAELYTWMQSELSRLYYEYYRLAFDVARRAEQTIKHELMRPELDAQTLVKFNYWDAGRKGLLSGEALHLDVKRMDLAYVEQNRREYELTKHVSLLQVDPLALIALRETGRCRFSLPEALFDMDGPGHYFRRIKSVSLSIPCVTGPFVGVNCELTLLRSSIRVLPEVDDSYGRIDSDRRFRDHYGSFDSIVVSEGRQDGGLSEPTWQPHLSPPFANAGAISEWELKLPADPRASELAQFDYRTISDVVLHLRYTARRGGELLAREAKKTLKDLLAEAQAPGCVRLLSIRHEFPTEWMAFKSRARQAEGRHELQFTMRPEHYPFWSRIREGSGSISRVDVFASAGDATDLVISGAAEFEDGSTNIDTLRRRDDLGLIAGQLVSVKPLAAPVGTARLQLSSNEIEDLWVAIAWRG